MNNIKVITCLVVLSILTAVSGCGKTDLAQTPLPGKIFLGAAAITGVAILASASQGSGSATTTTTIPDDPVVVEDGVTGGTFASSDGNFSADVVAGTMPAGLRSQPQVSKVAIDSTKVLGSGEVLVSDSYQLNLNSIANYITTNTVEVALAFDLSLVPSDKRTSQYVYAKVYDPGSEESVAVLGTISSSTLTLHLRGLAQMQRKSIGGQ